ncbi:hypothetical protein OROGR_018511 [Orobanche gracilis]
MANSKILINVFCGIFLASTDLLMICSEVTATMEPAETFINYTTNISVKEIEIHAARDPVQCGARDCCNIVNGVCLECCHLVPVDFANKICCQESTSLDVTCRPGNESPPISKSLTCCQWDDNGDSCNKDSYNCCVDFANKTCCQESSSGKVITCGYGLKNPNPKSSTCCKWIGNGMVCVSQ